MPFHDCIGRRNGGKVFINPRMLIKWHHHWSHNAKRACDRVCGDGGNSSRGGGIDVGIGAVIGNGRGGVSHKLASREFINMRRHADRLGASRGKLRSGGSSCQCPRIFSNGTADPPGQEVLFLTH